jgi:DNA excision repair protein ERCC-2
MVRLKGNVIKISVRQLVEFLLREGDLEPGTGASSLEAMNAGSRIHRKIQKRAGSFYRAEIPLKQSYDFQEYQVMVEGRADGIIEKPGESVVIDEIKGTYQNVELMEKPDNLHVAQAKCYGYMYALEKGLMNIQIQITYCHMESEVIRRFKEDYTFAELEVWFSDLIKEYKKWCDFVYEQRKLRNGSAKQVEFPYEYRPGQKELAHAVYRTIHRDRKLFAMAPTGVGKTLSVVYPAIKAVGDEKIEKIFYLTAKTITRTVAEENLDLLRGQGLEMSSIVLTAKDKVCVNEKPECNPELCPRAKGHFDRVNDALYDLITHEKKISRQVIESYAEKYQICPFEFGLDLSYFADMIICDYNYVFDPNVYLKRYFGESIKGEYTFLIDEAHNLVDRAREMYSAVLYEEDFADAKRYMRGKSRKVVHQLTRCMKQLEELKFSHKIVGNRSNRDYSQYELHGNVGMLQLTLLGLTSKIEEFMEEEPAFEHREKLWNLYFDARHFLNISERLDEHYEIFSEYTDTGDFKVKLFCINPEHNLAECFDKGKSTVLFSATLLPLSYYQQLLSNDPENYSIYIPSPFDGGNRMLAVGQDVSSKYTRRGMSEYIRMMEYMEKVTDVKRGNYFVFFPSYQMMQEVYQICEEHGLDIKCDLLMQTPSLTETEKETFLQEFHKSRKKSLLAFAVMGGIFSEGIDLKGESLIGAILIGTGLPMICNEREILKDHFDRQGLNGFDYAYRFPGMNKVLQAAGRVIRTDQDQGVILLLDERFLQGAYQNLFPREWERYQVCDVYHVEEQLQEFWENR